MLTLQLVSKLYKNIDNNFLIYFLKKYFLSIFLNFLTVFIKILYNFDKYFFVL